MGVENLKDIVMEVPKTAEKLYDDLVQPSSVATGQTFGLIPRAVKAALLPFEKWILHKEFQLEATKKILELKLSNVDPEKIISPEPYVLIPALEGISYAMDCDELRDLYANILSKAMNQDEKDKVHPAFVEIIKQLSPLDAQNLCCFSTSELLPIIKYIGTFLHADGSTHRERLFTNHFMENHHLANGGFDDMATVSKSLENLVRLGLIEIQYEEMLEESKYEKFYCSGMYDIFIGFAGKKTNTRNITTVDVIKGFCECTWFGETFINATIK